MRITRRQFVIGSATSLGAFSTPALARVSAAAARASAAAPISDFSILNRIAFGATPEMQAELAQLGLNEFLARQFDPGLEDAACDARLVHATLHIEYKDGEGFTGIKEDRPLKTLDASSETLWPLADGATKMAGQERQRPVQEVRAAAWIRAVHSRRQLQEVMIEFWHNHFNVNAFSDHHIGVMLPPYDAVMRRHCFGNFRALLEDVARSPAMLYYLNNTKSHASPANENYARELFELHTLGADHYYNALYNRWREVPGAVKGKPIGYIDQDVYEAARAFTGWTVEDGSNSGHGTTFAKSGKFTYFDGWHDNYQKRVLGTEFDPNTPPMADGRKVLDLLAHHPGTAMYLCTKLCRRFVADDPPPSLVKKAAAVWQKNLQSPDQVKRVLETIILSPEFAASSGMKTKRPFEFAVSFLRATGAEATPQENLFGHMNTTGYRQFEWPTPTGHPDIAEYWLNTNTTLGCWNLLPALLNPGFKSARIDLAAQMPHDVRHSGDIVAYWVERLTGRAPDADLHAALMQYMPQPGNADFIPDIHNNAFREPLQQMVMVIGMLPDFQIR